MKKLLIAAAVLALPLGAQAVSMPGFCAKGIGSAEAKVCAAPGSAESEGLVFAMYRAALEKLDAGPSKELQEQHTKWWDGVKKCSDAANLNACIDNAYGSRALQLQSSYKVAKTTGPVAFTCSDGSKFSATFLETTAEEGVVRALQLAPGDPDARLAGPELLVQLALDAGLEQGDLDAVLARLGAGWSNAPLIAERVDSIGIRLESL